MAVGRREVLARPQAQPEFFVGFRPVSPDLVRQRPEIKIPGRPEFLPAGAILTREIRGQACDGVQPPKEVAGGAHPGFVGSPGSQPGHERVVVRVRWDGASVEDQGLRWPGPAAPELPSVRESAGAERVVEGFVRDAGRPIGRLDLAGPVDQAHDGRVERGPTEEPGLRIREVFQPSLDDR